LGNAVVEFVADKLKPAPEDRHAAIWTILSSALAVVLLLFVAFYNGYPTVFSDTGSYLWTGAFHIPLAPYRAPGYSLFTNWTSFGTSGWFIVLMQAVIVVYVLRETCNYLTEGERKLANRCFLGSVCVLTALTSLPWLVSLLMPDVFAGVLFLSAFLLAFAGELNLIQRICLAVILMTAVGAHASLYPIAALVAAAILITRLAGFRPRSAPATGIMVLWLLLPMLAAGYNTAKLNRSMGLGFKIAPPKNTFLLARLFGDGLAANYLQENCPKKPLISCKYLSNLPRNQEDFMFTHPLIHDLDGHGDEVEEIVRGALLTHPLWFVISSIKETFRQLAAVRTGEEIRSHGSIDWTIMAIQKVLPRDLRGFLNSKQSSSVLLPLARSAAAVDTVFFWLSVAGCLAFAWTRRFERINVFLISTIVFLFINAAACASLAGVFDRYQARVAWIIPFCLTAYISCFVREWKRGDTPQALPAQNSIGRGSLNLPGCLKQ
jgi:hypothetical protein